MDKQKEVTRRIHLWQWMVLLLLIVEIGLVSAVNRQNQIVLKQDMVLKKMENMIAVKNHKIKMLSDRLVTVIGQLKSAFEEISK